MLKLVLPVASWVNGTIMIGIFALVCVGLVVTVVIFMNGGKKKEE